jgi:diacylglycerol O-acyltransferase
MMITIVLRFKGQINYDQLITELESVVRRYRRFRQRIVRPRGIFRRPYWEDDPSCRAENHVERLDLQLPADEAAVEELVNRKMNTALDFVHPLWKLSLVDNHPDGSIVLVRVHHCIADGISLMRVLLQMTHTSTEPIANNSPVDIPARFENQTNRAPGNMQTAPQGSPEISAVKPGDPVSITTGGALFKKPGITDMIAAITRIVSRSADPPTILKGPLGQVKKAVWSEPFSVPEIKKIAQYKQATINDVLMAVASGAIRRYMDLHNDKRKRNIRAFILVNLRGRSIDEELGNKFGLVFLNLPIDREQPLERLDEIKRGMDSLKASAEYAATYFILGILGLMPEWVEHLATRFLDTKGTIVATNVPGSRRLLYLADTPIQSITGFVPQSGRIGVGLSFISYNDQLEVGLNADAGLIPDPEKFIELFDEEYKYFRAAIPTDS